RTCAGTDWPHRRRPYGRRGRGSSTRAAPKTREYRAPDRSCAAREACRAGPRRCGPGSEGGSCAAAVRRGGKPTQLRPELPLQREKRLVECDPRVARPRERHLHFVDDVAGRAVEHEDAITQEQRLVDGVADE